MISTKFLPSFFKEVLTHIPTLALKSVDWKGILKELGPVLLRLGKDRLEDSKIELLKRDLKSKLEFKQFNSVDVIDENTAKGILKLYFDQLNSSEGMVIDLRSKFFTWEDQKLNWNPSNIWYQMDDKFRLSLIKIYQGFYYEDDQLFSTGLVEIGLSENLDEDKKSELESLFRAHFGQGLNEPIKFELEKFQESFYHLFKFFVDNEVALSKDFLFVGIYLVTLYMSLEKYGKELDVKSAFMEVFPKA
jgi:hypothetical protein